MDNKQIYEIFSTRLQHIRKLRGMSLRDLVAATDNAVSVQTLSNYEKGLSFPNGAIMTSLVDALHVSVDALFTEPKVNWGLVNFTYRKRKSLTERTDSQIEESVKEYAERYMEIENILEIVPDASFRDGFQNTEVRTIEDARSVANNVRNKYQFGEAPIVSLHDFLEEVGVKLIGVDIDSKFDGTNFICDRHSFIIYNSANNNAERTRFTIAHELGHLLMNIPDDVNEDEVEKLCNSFASELLLPQSKLRTILGDKREGISLVELKRIRQLYGMSIEAILYAACEIGIITKDRHKRFLIVVNKNPNIKEEIRKSVYDKEQDNDRFTSLVYRALSNNVISVSKASMLLGKSIEELTNESVLS